MKRGYLFWAAVLTLVTIAASIVIYPKLPDRIPIHWNSSGQIDNWGDKSWAAFLLPAMMLGMLVLFRVLPWLSPRNFEIESFRPTYEYITFVIVLLMGFAYVITIRATLDSTVDVGRFLVAGVFFGLALIGNVLGKVERNFYIGIRTPWTLADDRVWHATHRLGGRVIAIGGALASLVVLATGWTKFSIGLLLAAIVIPVIYSLVYYKQLQRRGEL
jgi:uncharacterized membrane protein